MQNRWRLRSGLTTLVAVTLFSMPQLGLARQRCDNQGSYSQNYRYRDGYRNDTYRNNNYSRDRYNNSAYRDSGYYDDGYGDYRSTRSAGKSAAIIGGSAAAGAVLGGLTGGKKGAIIGAAVGGVGGLIYDRTTKDNQRRW
jgi:hypothetical protein